MSNTNQALDQQSNNQAAPTSPTNDQTLPQLINSMITAKTEEEKALINSAIAAIAQKPAAVPAAKPRLNFEARQELRRYESDLYVDVIDLLSVTNGKFSPSERQRLDDYYRAKNIVNWAYGID